MKLSEIKGSHKYQTTEGNDYIVRVADGDNLIIVACVEVGKAAAAFEHPNVLHKEHRIFEYKHYRKGGGKLWTKALGVEIAFAVPKTAIELIQEPGYSYVTVKINDVLVTLNVSGGSGNNEWTDYIGPRAHLCGTRSMTVKTLKAIAEVSLDPIAARLQGVNIEPEPIEQYQIAQMVEMLARREAADRLQSGAKIALYGCNWQGSKEVSLLERPKSFRNRAKQCFICGDHYSRVRIKFSQVDWTLTAAANGITLPKIHATVKEAAAV